MSISVFFVLMEFFTAFYSRFPSTPSRSATCSRAWTATPRLAPWMWTSMLLAAASLVLLLVPRYRRNEQAAGRGVRHGFSLALDR